MVVYRNIDDFIPKQFERLGELKGKRWYINKENYEKGLFKPQKKDCLNQYGEYMGYVLAKNSGVPSCKVELAHLDRYFPNIHKERNHGTPNPKDGSIIYSELQDGEELIMAVVFDEDLLRRKYDRSKSEDDIDLNIEAMEDKIRHFYENQEVDDEYVDKIVDDCKNKFIQMCVYDCLYGNKDRHNENWGLCYNQKDISFYPLYDNERVLGLYESEEFVSNALEKDEEYSDEMFFSRLKVPGEKKSTYKDVLKYLMEEYPEKTLYYLEQALTSNTLENVKRFLDECEELTPDYKEYGMKMYKKRYEFALDLYKSNEKDKER